ncbi:MAG: tetratricopeptide repeat protein [Candidatus Eisenbacteria bacterium]
MLDRRRFRRADALFAELLELPPEERAARLASSAADDPKLRAVVEDLLRIDQQTQGEFLETSPLQFRSENTHSTGTVVKAGSGYDAAEDGSKQTDLEQLGRYVIEREIGRGGGGIVYCAWDPDLERRVAVKLLPAAVRDDVEAVERMQREARILAGLQHAHICTVFSLEESGGVWFFTQELLTGESLAERLRSGPLGEPATRLYGSQIAAALEAAHRRGVIHRDLKPGNVVIDSEGGAKVLDFGIAALVGASNAGGTMVGTPGYMSPEQILGEGPDRADDVFTLGALLFECVTGVPAFPGSDPDERIQAALAGEPDWDVMPPGVSADFVGILHDCLEKSRSDRRMSAADVRRRLSSGPSLSPSTDVVRTQTDRPGRLPTPPTPFVGREVTLLELDGVVATSPILTLTGIGGGGKSRLALEVALRVRHEFPDGAWWVELAALSDPRAVATEVAATLGLETPGRDAVIDVLVDRLRTRRVLLVLDNCEHLRSACASLAGAVGDACPDVRILATSREPLGLRAEVVFPVPTLAVPDETTSDDVARISRSEAVRFFLEYAARARPDFHLTNGNASIVAYICRRLDGIPLALELAAARMRLLSEDEIARRLDQRFRLLGSRSPGSLPRHQTLRATLDWSYELLEPAARVLFVRLSVFSGGWTLPAAEAVCPGGGLERDEILDLHDQLLDRSLIEPIAISSNAELETHGAAGPMPRFRMLETVRAYAAERCEELGDATFLTEHHADYFATLVLDAGSRYLGSEQAKEFGRLDRDLENIRSALDHAIRANDATRALGMTGILGWYWLVRGYWAECAHRIQEVLARPDWPRTTAEYSHVHLAAGNLAHRRGALEEAREHFLTCLEVDRSLGDEARVAADLHSLGVTAEFLGELRPAAEYYEEALALNRRLGDEMRIADNLAGLGSVQASTGNPRLARTTQEEACAIRRRLGLTVLLGVSLNGLGNLALRLGDVGTARFHHEESLALRRQVGDKRGATVALTNLARVHLAEGDAATARCLLEKSLVLKTELQDGYGIAKSLDYLGLVDLAEGDPVAAQSRHLEAIAFYEKSGDRTSHAESSGYYGRAAHRAGDLALAASACADSLQGRLLLGNQIDIAETVRWIAILAVDRGEPDEFAAQLLAAAAATYEEQGIPVDPLDRAELARVTAELSARMGETEWASATARGDIEAAAAAALREFHRGKKS